MTCGIDIAATTQAEALAVEQLRVAVDEGAVAGGHQVADGGRAAGRRPRAAPMRVPTPSRPRTAAVTVVGAPLGHLVDDDAGDVGVARAARRRPRGGALAATLARRPGRGRRDEHHRGVEVRRDRALVANSVGAATSVKSDPTTSTHVVPVGDGVVAVDDGRDRGVGVVRGRRRRRRRPPRRGHRRDGVPGPLEPRQQQVEHVVVVGIGRPHDRTEHRDPADPPAQLVRQDPDGDRRLARLPLRRREVDAGRHGSARATSSRCTSGMSSRCSRM